MVGLTLILAATIGAQAPTTSGSAQGSPQRPQTVSLARIRAGLNRPPVLRLTLPDPKPDFRIDIRERRFIEDLLDRLDFRSGPMPRAGVYAYEQQQRLGIPEIAQPLVSVDALPIARAVRDAIAGARRAHKEAVARDEVQRALAEFCATHECP